MLTNAAQRRILLGVMFLLLWAPAAVKLLAPLAQSVVAEMAGGNVAPAQRPCLNDNCDFIPFWSAGRLADGRQTAQIYDGDLFLRWERKNLFSGALANYFYLYPPPNLLFLYPLGFFPFQAAYLFWSVGLIGGGIALLRYAGLSWFVALSGLLSVPALFSLRLGQFGFFVGALFTAGIFSIESRPLRGAALLALLVMKPQAGFLAPVVLLARREWRALAVGAGVVVLICGAVTGLLGTAVWRNYFLYGVGLTRHVLLSHVNSTSVSVFWMLSSFNLPLRACYAGQALAAMFAVADGFYIWRWPQAGQRERTALTIFLSLLISPYGYTADLCGYCMAVALLAEAAGRITLFDMLLWLAPVICMNIGVSLHVIIMPIFILAGIFRVIRSSRERNAVACA